MTDTTNANALAILDQDRDFILVPGAIKSTMKGLNAASADLYKVRPQHIRVIDDFNVRVRDADYLAHKARIKQSIKANGFYPDEPLAGYVASEMHDGEKVNVLYVTDGHTRLEATLEAIAEGAEIEHVPMVVSNKGADIKDLTLGLILKNSGKPLKPLETALVCRRLAKYGMDENEIAEKTGFTLQYVRDLLTLSAAPMQVREMVEAGTVSATLAVEYMRKHANEAGAALQAAFDRAKSAGKGKVTKRFAADAQFNKFVRKTGSDLVSTLEVVKADAGFASLSEETRKRIEELVEQAAKARTAMAASADDADKAEESTQASASASEDAMQEAAIRALAGGDAAANGTNAAQAEPEFVAA